MQSGQFVRWESEDFSHVGMVLEFGETVTLVTQEGEMTFPADDGTLTKIRRPKNFHFFGNPQDIMPKAPVKKVAKEKKLSAKEQQAVDLIKAHIDAGNDLPSRPEGMKMLIEQLGFKQGTASTYFATAKRILSA